jgi:hypothetical protein
MEETNPEFFKAYHAQLRVKEQERSVPFRLRRRGYHWSSVAMRPQVTAFNMLVNQQIKVLPLRHPLPLPLLPLSPD